MKTKIYLSLIVAILITLVVSGTALAGAEASHPEVLTALRSRLKFGEVVEIGSETFSIKILDGGIYTYLVDGNTRFEMRNIEKPCFFDLELGAFVIVAPQIKENELVARVVAIMPEGFNPSRWFGIRVRGEVLDIDTDSGTFIVLIPTGEEIVFSVSSRTRYIGAASGLEKLEIGWFVGVAAGEQADGTYSATLLASLENRRHVKQFGLVTEVDSALGTISISTRSDDEVSFYVKANTRFFSRENQVEGISDLDVDMVAVVVARQEVDGSFHATHIAAARAEDLPSYDVKKGGRIIKIGTNYFTILSQAREEVTFRVNSDSNFRGRGVDVQSLDDLDIGMIALVGGDSEENGDTMAKLIIVIRNLSE